MDLLEILIDKLLIYLPPDIPFLSTLIQQPEGRYIVFGLALVIVLLVVWTLLASLQMFQASQQMVESTEAGQLLGLLFGPMGRRCNRKKSRFFYF